MVWVPSFSSMRVFIFSPSSFSKDCSALSGMKLLCLKERSERQQPASFHTFQVVFYLQEDKSVYNKIRQTNLLKRKRSDYSSFDRAVASITISPFSVIILLLGSRNKDKQLCKIQKFSYVTYTN